MLTLSLNLMSERFVRRYRRRVLMAIATDLTTHRGSASSLHGGRRRDVGGAIFAGVLLLALIASLGVLIAAVLETSLSHGIPVLADRGLRLHHVGPSARPTKAGMGQALVGSILMMVIVALVAFPLGVGAAVYLEEYARDTRLDAHHRRPTSATSPGVPSIVYGILGSRVFVEALNARRQHPGQRGAA